MSPGGGQFSLTVNVTGLKPLKGDLYVSLHNRPEYFTEPDSSFLKKIIAINEETEVFSFDHVPAGKYAIAVYHDENLNGTMETNENGIPKEGYGFSTKSRFLGKPKFKQAAFEVTGNDTIEIKMIYHNVQGSKKDSIK
ncbi:MAG: DUF2141 domain-containing protein [Bacteroidales bacterium]|nr:DUF2141 domain-containing protein [Bacteroidales bacterium]